MSSDRPSQPRRVDWLLLALACTVFAVLGARWLWLFRRGNPLDIDEAGYQSLAVMNLRSLAANGPDGWISSVLGPSIQAPLMTASTTPVYGVFGIAPINGLIVPLFFGCVTLAAAFALGRAVGGRRVQWFCLALVAASPLVITYSRSYNFAIASTATVTLTLWAIARSRNFDRLTWSIAAGVCLGLVVLSRTMTIAFVPGFALAALIAVVTAERRLRRLGNVMAGVVAALAVAGPWYWRNGLAVWDYLVSFGYGSRSDEYGSDESVLSAGSWLRTMQYLLQWEGLLAVSLTSAGLLLLLAWSMRQPAPSKRKAARRWAASLLMPSAVYAAWGIFILTSTGNKGSGFLGPLVPAIALLAAFGLARLRGPAFVAATAAVCSVVLVNTAAAADLRSPLADPRYVTLPFVGAAPVVDGRGTIQVYISHGMRDPAEGSQPMSVQQQKRWTTEIRKIQRDLQAETMDSLTAFGFRHRLVNLNSVQLAQMTSSATPLPLDMIDPDEAEEEDSIVEWLAAGNGVVPVCTLLLASGESMEFGPVVDQHLMRQAARTAGYALTGQSWPLPDGRVVKAWRSSSCII